MSDPPDRSAEQRRAALEHAAKARRVRAGMKRRLAGGEVGLTELLEEAESDDIIAGTKVLAVLESLPGIGKVKARRTMERIGIAQSRRLRGLGSAQREALLGALDGG